VNALASPPAVNPTTTQELAVPSATLPWSRRLARKIRRSWAQIVREEGSPGRLGMAVALGVFWGCVPAWGVQIFLTVASAKLLRLNRLVAFTTCFIGAPPVTPFLIFGSVELGHFLLHGSWVTLSVDAVREMSNSEIFARFALAYFVGGTVIGMVVAAIAGPLSARMIRISRERSAGTARLSQEELDALFDRLDSLRRRYRQYGAWKARLDPLYPLALPELQGRSEVLDLGAGMGLLAALLTARSPGTRVRSVEWDKDKADTARVLLTGTKAVSEEGDAFKVDLGTPDAICLFDILHYTPLEKQQDLLGRCCQALPEGGVLLIREFDPESEKNGWAQRIERWGVMGGWNMGGGVHPWPLSQMTRFLEERGFTVVKTSAGKGFYNTNAFLKAKRLDKAV
jgi:uncharacterized protein (DUF2062 family)/SAM-dependent methyltransferase